MATKTQSVGATPRAKRPIQIRRPKQISFRLAQEEHDGLWAMHIDTRKSFSQCLREIISEGLKSRGYLDVKTAKEIMSREKVVRMQPRPPVI